jgi:hypothetical protein
MTATSKDRPKYVSAKDAGAKAERLMGPNGPLRLFSTTRFAKSIFYESRDWNGFAGLYVCDTCLEPSPMGLMRSGETWTCGICRIPKATASPAVRERMRIAREARKGLAEIATSAPQAPE